MPRPRPLQENTSAPAGRLAAERAATQRERMSAGRGRPRRRRARAGARPGPGRTGAPTAIAPVVRGRRRRSRARGSRPGRSRACSVSTHDAEQQPAGEQAALALGRATRSPRAASGAAGLPASSSIVGRRPAVIVSSGPTGAAPCETHGSISTSSRRRPTAPPVDDARRREKSAASPSGVRAEATPPSIGTVGVRPASSRSSSVGRERERVGQAGSRRPRPRARGSRRRRARRRAGSTVAWNGVATPPSSAAAHTATAVPPSTSRPSPSTPPAPQPISARGVERLVHRGKRSPRDRRRCSPEANTTATSAGASPRPTRGLQGALERRGASGSVPSRDAGADADAHPPPTILRRCRPPSPATPRCPSSRCSARPASARPPWPPRWPSWLRFRGEDPVAVSADALQVYAGLEILTGAPPQAVRARLEHRLVSFLPVDATFSAGQYAAARPRRDRRRARRRPPADRGRRHRPLPARRARRRSTCARRPRRGVRERLEARLEQRGARGAARRARRPSRPGRPRRSTRATRRRVVRALELHESGELVAARRARTACGPTTRATRRCSSGSSMEREALYAAIDARVDSMVAGGRGARRSRARTPPAPRRRRARRSGSASC